MDFLICLKNDFVSSHIKNLVGGVVANVYFYFQSLPWLHLEAMKYMIFVEF